MPKIFSSLLRQLWFCRKTASLTAKHLHMHMLGVYFVTYGYCYVAELSSSICLAAQLDILLLCCGSVRQAFSIFSPAKM
jgi:hypothetical protein